MEHPILDLQSSSIAKLDECHQCVSKVRALAIHQWQLHSTSTLVRKTGRTAVDLTVAGEGTSKTLCASIYGLLQFITAGNYALLGRMEFRRQLDIRA